MDARAQHIQRIVDRLRIDSHARTIAVVDRRGQSVATAAAGQDLDFGPLMAIGETGVTRCLVDGDPECTIWALVHAGARFAAMALIARRLVLVACVDGPPDAPRWLDRLRRAATELRALDLATYDWVTEDDLDGLIE
ncbi:MAG: hypothetical protein R3B09_35415 [Nannocystaceae bacterium]